MHVRARLRYAVAALVTGLVPTGNRVYRSRAFVLSRDQLPSLSVYTPEEEVLSVTLEEPSTIQRNLTVVIEGHAEKDDLVEDILDEIALAVELAMAASITVDAIGLPAQLLTTSTQIIDEGDIPLGVIRLTYQIPYSTLETTPETLN